MSGRVTLGQAQALSQELGLKHVSLNIKFNMEVVIDL